VEQRVKIKADIYMTYDVDGLCTFSQGTAVSVGCLSRRYHGNQM